MRHFELLNQELDQWNFNGEEAMLWWRDDDAQKITPGLSRLTEIAEQYDVPVAIAAIPQGVEDSLVEWAKKHAILQIVQHGYSHQNHAADHEKKQELGIHRNTDEVVTELLTGFSNLQHRFEEQFIPALVPPWNRIHDTIIQQLPSIGLKGLSCYGARPESEPVSDIWLINTHADIINWKQNKSFLGEELIIKQLVSHLRQKREGECDVAEPTGLLTHHLVHDESCWQFLQQLFAVLDDHPAATWLSAERVFQTKWR